MKKFYNCFRDNYFYFFAYAVLGWIYELFYFIIVDDKIINRGFLHGPYLPIYGFGALVLLLLLKDIRHKKIKLANINISPVIMFIIIFIVTTIVEYIGHFILDKGFNIILWDYSNDFLNINGRVCFAASRNFAIGGTACLYFVQPIFEKIVKELSDKKKNFIFIILFLIVIIDFLITIL